MRSIFALPLVHVRTLVKHQRVEWLENCESIHPGQCLAQCCPQWCCLQDDQELSPPLPTTDQGHARHKPTGYEAPLPLQVQACTWKCTLGVSVSLPPLHFPQLLQVQPLHLPTGAQVLNPLLPFHSSFCPNSSNPSRV